MPKISDHSAINAQKINAKENCENVKGTDHDFLLVRKTHISSSEAKKYTYISKQITKSPQIC